MIAADNFSPGGSDYDRQKMYNILTVLDINYWLANAQYLNLNFPIKVTGDSFIIHKLEYYQFSPSV